MRTLTNKDGHLLSQVDNVNEETGIDDEKTDNINITSLKYMIFNNQTTAVNKGKIKAQLALEIVFGFCKTIEKVTKNLGFHLTLKTANLQNLFYTALADAVEVNVKFNSLSLYVPSVILSTETQLLFNESIQNNYRIFCDEWYTESRIVTDQVYQFDNGRAQSVNSPKNLICAHQSEDR